MSLLRAINWQIESKLNRNRLIAQRFDVDCFGINRQFMYVSVSTKSITLSFLAINYRMLDKYCHN